ncbi:hypothetical protein BH24ACT26_BH24ACT26_22920 [soil metagenome]
MSKDVSVEAIETAEFSTSLRGYDKDEVDAFLRMVGAEHRRLLEAGRTVSNNQEKPYHRLGADVGELLQHAKDSADALKRKAEEDCARMREEAKKSVAAAKEKAEKHAQEIRKAAEYDASERAKDAQRRLEELKAIEASINEQLEELRGRLSSVLDQLTGTAGPDAASTVPAPETDGSPDEGPETPAEREEGEQRVIRIDAETESSVS